MKTDDTDTDTDFEDEWEELALLEEPAARTEWEPEPAAEWELDLEEPEKAGGRGAWRPPTPREELELLREACAAGDVYYVSPRNAEAVEELLKLLKTARSAYLNDPEQRGTWRGGGEPPRDEIGWNLKLREAGLGVDDEYPDDVPLAELDRRLSLAPGDLSAERRWVADTFGTQPTVISLAPGRGGPGRRPATDRATRVTAADGSTDWMNIGNDEAAIRKLLTKDGFTIEDFSPAIARGRRSQRASEMREILGKRVAEVLDRGATNRAIAAVLGCSDKTVRALAK